MSTVLERYFEQQVTLPEEKPDAFTPTERAFLERYLGSDFESADGGATLPRPAKVESVTGPLAAAPPAPIVPEAAAQTWDAAEDGLEAALREARELKLVGFRVGGQELAVPIAQVQEVIRSLSATKLPAASAHILGIVNLRGRVVPLLSMASLLGLPDREGEDRFIIVCRRHDMLLGLVVGAIAAMHQARGDDVEWGVEARVGVSADLIAGLLKVGDLLVKILSVDSLFQKVLKS
ncbi:MAG: chemotaxis protein CheW [Desulfovibrionaceae bacterium]